VVLVAVPILIVAVILAAAWALVMMGNRALVQPFAEWLAGLLGPLGGVIFGAIDTFNGWITASYDAAFNSAVTPLAHFIAAIPTHAVQLGDIAISLFRALVYELNAMGGTLVDAATGIAIDLLTAQVASVRDFANFINDVRIPNTEWFISAVQAELWGALNALTARYEATVAALPQSIDDALAGVLGAVYGAIDAARASAAAAVADIEAGIDARLAGWGASIESNTATLVDGLSRQLEALRQALVQAIPGLEARIGAAEAAAVVAGTLTATQIKTVTDWIHDCGEPLCTHFGPEIPFVQAFADLLAAGLVAGLVADAIADPEGTARRVDDMTGGPLATVSGIFRSMGA